MGTTRGGIYNGILRVVGRTPLGRGHPALPTGRLDEDLDAYIAWDSGERIGAATYRLERDDCELMSLNAQIQWKGVGTALLHEVEEAARRTGCPRVRPLTSNDNLGALRFYQRRGYRLIAIHPGAIDGLRTLKPSIPVTGHHGIPIRDEIELEKRLWLFGSHLFVSLVHGNASAHGEGGRWLKTHEQAWRPLSARHVRLFSRCSPKLRATIRYERKKITTPIGTW